MVNPRLLTDEEMHTTLNLPLVAKHSKYVKVELSVARLIAQAQDAKSVKAIIKQLEGAMDKHKPNQTVTCSGELYTIPKVIWDMIITKGLSPPARHPTLKTDTDKFHSDYRR